MAKGINKVILLGNLGSDPEIHKANSGATIAVLSLATSEQWKDKQTGELQSRTEWHRIKIFGKLADVAEQYLKKGSKLYVEGKLMTEKYTAQDGSDRYSTVIVCREFQMLDSRQDSSPGNSEQDSGNNYPNDFPDDDIPF